MKVQLPTVAMDRMVVWAYCVYGDQETGHLELTGHGHGAECPDY